MLTDGTAMDAELDPPSNCSDRTQSALELFHSEKETQVTDTHAVSLEVLVTYHEHVCFVSWKPRGLGITII